MKVLTSRLRKGVLEPTLKTTQNGQNTLKYTYTSKGEIATTEDALHRVTGYLYDEVGRVKKITYPDGRFVGYSYNSDGKITEITPPGKPAHAFSYNLFELPDTYSPPLLSGAAATQTTYEYNLDKQMTFINRPDGESIEYIYDDVTGLLLNFVFNNLKSQIYTYIPETEMPHTIVSPDLVESEFTYFGLDRIASEEQTVDNNTYGTYFAFDNFFRPIQRILKSDGVEIGRVDTTYRLDGQPSQIGAMNLNYYASSGRLMSTNLDKIYDQRTYDAFGNLKTYRATYDVLNNKACLVDGCGDELYFYTLTRDSLHRIVTKVERVQGVTTSYEYSYDSAGRLVGVTKNGMVDSSFVYDSNSNRTSGTQNGISFTATFDAQDRLLTYTLGAEPVQNFYYNDNGELTSITKGVVVTTLASDSLGRLKSWNDINYKLDWTGRRVERSVGTAPLSRAIFEDTYRLAAEVNSTTLAVKEYAFETNINSAEYMKDGTNIYRIIKDHLGSPRLVVHVSSGVVAQKMDYNEWGKVTVDTNPGLQPFGFAGGLYDKDTKLVKFGARDYDGSVGRWLSKDPIRFNGGDTNLFGYVMQDPINFIDPRGLYSWQEFTDDVSKAVDDMEEMGDYLEEIRKKAFCKINKKGCGTDPAEKPIPEDDEKDFKNMCPL